MSGQVPVTRREGGSDHVGNPRPGKARGRRLAVNALSILSSEAVVRATSFILYAFVGRNLDAYAFGQLTLALALVYTFQILASVGQRTLMIREIARDPAGIRRQLRTITVIVAGGSVVALAPLAALIAVLGWDRSTAGVILVAFVGLFPFALSQTLEAMMQGLEQMRFIAFVNIPVHVAKVLLVLALLWRGAGVMTVAAIVAGTYWLVLAVELAVLFRRLIPAEAAPGPISPAANVRRGLPFLGVEVVYAVTTLIPVLVVSGIKGEEAVGVLGAAQQATLPLALAVNSLVAVAYPAMCRTFGQGADRVRLVVVNLLDALLMLLVPFIIGVSVFAPFVTRLLYGSTFDGSAHLLRILVWWAIVNLIGTVLGQTLWATDRERISLVIGVAVATTSLVAHLILVPLLGLNGVVVATGLAAVVLVVMHYRPMSRTVSVGDLLSATWRSGVAGLAQLVSLVGLVAWGALAGGAASLVVYVGVLWLVTRIRVSDPDRQQPLASVLHQLGGS